MKFVVLSIEREKHGRGDGNGQRRQRTQGSTGHDAFASVGATQFDLTITMRNGTKETYRRGMKLADLIRTLPAILDSATRQQRNVIVRPYGLGVSFIQLDDLRADMLTHLAPAVFLILKTSPGNFQAWVVIPGAEDKVLFAAFAKAPKPTPRRAAQRERRGAKISRTNTRPTFRASQSNRRRQVERRQKPNLNRASNRRMPDYARCLEGAPLNSDKTGPDISRPDYTFALIAADWGCVEETAARLMQVSPKAQESGEAYALRTARAEAAAVNSRGKGTHRSNPAQTPKQG